MKRVDALKMSLLFLALALAAGCSQGGSFSPIQQAANSTTTQPLANPGQPQDCNSIVGAGKDDCLRSNAVQNRDLAGCEAVSDATMRQSCITEIAKMVRNPSICAELSDKNDIDLCNLYAKAGEG